MDESINHVGKNVLIHLRRGDHWIPVLAPLRDRVDEEPDAPLPCPDVLLVSKGGKRAQNGDPSATPVYVPFIQGKIVQENASGVVVEMDTDHGGVVHSWFPRGVILSISVVHRLGERRVVQPVNSPLIAPP